ncbi:MAG: hypothetical protein LBU67_09680 [Oscillospiraceae bacterium]|jgi:type II secretory pathway pseudopilin PulG|nr:hypothetical protein [Oscillospiraceae bacterium]
MQNENKSNVLLTELVIVVLFFSLIAVTVVQMFVAAHQKSVHNTRVQQALIVAQNWAETLSGQADPASTLLAAGFLTTGEIYARAEEAAGLRVEARLQPEVTSPGGKLVSGEIAVFDALYTLGEDEDPAQPLAALPVQSYIPVEEVQP